MEEVVVVTGTVAWVCLYLVLEGSSTSQPPPPPPPPASGVFPMWPRVQGETVSLARFTSADDC